MPTKLLTGIDNTTRGRPYYLAEEDQCWHYGEFFIKKGWSAGPTNQLIKNYKRTPTELTTNAYFPRHKQRAIVEIASDLRGSFPPEHAANYTFVPMPSSKTPGHADHCDRLDRTLRHAFTGGPYANVDIRSLLRQTQSIDADHLSGGDRIPYDELLAITEVDQTKLQPPLRQAIVLFDDVVTSGKHFKVAKTRIREVFPEIPIYGIFVARAIHPNPADDFESLDA